MAKINLMRLLCLRSHCLAVLAFDEATTTPADAQAVIELSLGLPNLTMLCGTCYSSELHFEISGSEFGSLEEATPHLIDERLKDLEARKLRENLRRTAKNN